MTEGKKEMTEENQRRYHKEAWEEAIKWLKMLLWELNGIKYESGQLIVITNYHFCTISPSKLGSVWYKRMVSILTTEILRGWIHKNTLWNNGSETSRR
jgi:hypothetical protein